MPGQEWSRDKQQVRLDFKGMNTVMPMDLMPSGKYPYAQNVRAYIRGGIIGRTTQASLYSLGTGPVTDLRYMNDYFNSADPANQYLFARVQSITTPGYGEIHINGGSALAAVVSPYGSMLPFRPSNSPQPWMYVYSAGSGDALYKMRSDGLLYQQGIVEPQVAPTVSSGGPGNLFGQFRYFYVYRSSLTGAVSNPSPPSAVYVTPFSEQLSVTSAQSPDPQVDWTDFYRQDIAGTGALANPTYVGSTPPGGTFADDLTDLAVAANPILSYANFEPFPTVGLPVNGSCSWPGGQGPAVLTITAGSLPLNLLPGTSIIVGFIAGTTVARPSDPTHVLVELQSVLSPSSWPFSIRNPILARTALAWAWGPTDNTQFIFAVGDPNNPGRLYWTTGNNPDSASDSNTLDITSGSEILMNGCIVGGIGMVFSNQRAWLIYPNFFNATATAAGVVGTPWTLVESIATRGLIARRGLTTDGGGNVYFVSTDGVYMSPGGNGAQLISQDIDNLFPHEGNKTSVPAVIVRGGQTIYPPSYGALDQMSLRMAGPFLYFDHLNSQGVPQTLVYDSSTAGWTLDVYADPVTVHGWEDLSEAGAFADERPVCGTIAGNIYTLTIAGSEACSAVVAMPCDNAGDARAPKQWGDIYLRAGIDPGTNLNLVAYGNLYQTTVPVDPFTISSTSGTTTAGPTASVALVTATPSPNTLAISCGALTPAITAPIVSLRGIAGPTGTGHPQPGSIGVACGTATPGPIAPVAIVQGTPNVTPVGAGTLAITLGTVVAGLSAPVTLLQGILNLHGPNAIAVTLGTLVAQASANVVSVQGSISGVNFYLTVFFDSMPFVFGQTIYFSGLTNATWLNGQFAVIDFLFGNQIRANVGTWTATVPPSYGPTTDTGTGAVLAGSEMPFTVGQTVSFSGMTNAPWLNGYDATIRSISGNTFYADEPLNPNAPIFPYGPATDTGIAALPSVLNGVMPFAVGDVVYFSGLNTAGPLFLSNGTSAIISSISGSTFYSIDGGWVAAMAGFGGVETFPYGPAPDTGTAQSQIVSGVMPFSVGQRVGLAGLTNQTWLNGQFAIITSISGNVFYFRDVGFANSPNLPFGPTQDTGTATIPAVVSGAMPFAVGETVTFSNLVDSNWLNGLNAVISSIAGNVFYSTAGSWTTQIAGTGGVVQLPYGPAPDSGTATASVIIATEQEYIIDFEPQAEIYQRDLGMVLSWLIGHSTFLSLWQPSFVAVPENIDARVSQWDDAGNIMNKWVQGFLIEGDTSGQVKQLSAQGEHGQIATPTEAVVLSGRSVQAFSFPAPMITHMMRLNSGDDEVPWRCYSLQWIYEPYPEACMNWVSEPTSHGFLGWQHLREMNIGHRSNSNLTLTVTPDYGPASSYIIPSSNNIVTKTKVTINGPNKFKIMQYAISSSSPFYLFIGDIEVKIGVWARTGGYQQVKPFGGPSKLGALV